jgi:hypothetical protein
MELEIGRQGVRFALSCRCGVLVVVVVYFSLGTAAREMRGEFIFIIHTIRAYVLAYDSELVKQC